MLDDKYFIDIAERTAEESKCISLKVGCVIVKNKRIIVTGYNGTVQGTLNCCDAFDEGCFKRDEHREWQTIHEIHAEMNALMFAVKEGISVKDCIMYCTYEPCDNCLKHIIQAGIKIVIYRYEAKPKNRISRYRELGLIELIKY